MTFSYDPPTIDRVNTVEPDANGAAIVIDGENFGTLPSSQSLVQMKLDGDATACQPIAAFGEARYWTSNWRVRCETKRLDVRPRKLTVWVLNQSSAELELGFSCPRGDYGLSVQACSNLIGEGRTYAGSLAADASAGVTTCEHEFCKPCPAGATCPGKDELPRALDGFWRSRDRRADFIPCTPKAACMGGEDVVCCNVGEAFSADLSGCCDCSTSAENRQCRRYDGSVVPASGSKVCEAGSGEIPAQIMTCHSVMTCEEGYTGTECAKCARRYYRLVGLCEPCPNWAGMYIVIAIVMLVAFCGAGYFLAKREVNLSGLGIGVDYLQTLAMFSAFNFKWPNTLHSIFTVVSSTTFNTELLATECSVDWGFKEKWTLVMCLVPLLVLTFAFIWLMCVIADRWKECRNPELHRQRDRRSVAHSKIEEMFPELPRGGDHGDTGIGDALFGAFITTCYFTYFVVAVMDLTVFDCSEVNDGTLRMDISPDQHCYKAGSMHETLLPYAWICFVLFLIILLLILKEWLKQV